MPNTRLLPDTTLQSLRLFLLPKIPSTCVHLPPPYLPPSSSNLIQNSSHCSDSHPACGSLLTFNISPAIPSFSLMILADRSGLKTSSGLRYTTETKCQHHQIVIYYLVMCFQTKGSCITECVLAFGLFKGF